MLRLHLQHVDQLIAAIGGLDARWTGNALQVVDLSFHDWRKPTKHHRRLLSAVERGIRA